MEEKMIETAVNTTAEVATNVAPAVAKEVSKTTIKVATGAMMGTSAVGVLAIAGGIGFGVYKLVKFIRSKKEAADNTNSNK